MKTDPSWEFSTTKMCGEETFLDKLHEIIDCEQAEPYLDKPCQSMIVIGINNGVPIVGTCSDEDNVVLIGILEKVKYVLLNSD